MPSADLEVIFRYVAIIIYVMILGGITWLSARRKGIEDFLYASHNIDWKPLAVSLFASVISSYNVVVILSFSYIYGPYVVVIFLGVLLAFLGIYFIARRYKEIISTKGFSNIVDFFAHQFDTKTASVLNLALVGVLFLFIALQLFINTSIFSELMGWNKYLSSVFVGAIVLIYITLGGLKAEIFTDVFQGILMLLIVSLVFMVDVTSISTQTINSILTDRTILIGALSLAIAQFLTLLVQPEMWQRVIAARNIQHLKKGLIASWILLTIFVIPIILISLTARSTNMTQDTNTLFYDVLNATAPSWFFPFLVVGLFAAFMSTLDSSLFAIASQLGKYGFWIKSIRKQDAEVSIDHRNITRNIRLAIVAVTVVALIASLFFANFLQGVFGLVSLLTVISVAVLGSFVLKLSTNETFVAVLAGIVAFAFAFFGGHITQKAVTTLYPSFLLIGYIVLQKAALRMYKRLSTR